ncbi:MAG: DUF1329 domain-containing protein, partial [Azonexus sp.]|nr:DUF1329 domain-containing protein [Azonexus sp.]
MKKNLSLLSAALILAFAGSVHAQVSAADAAKLGKSLTPVGAEAAANAAGTIPAWTGGLTKAVAGHQPGGHYPDPFANDKVLFTIDASNVDKYKASLTPGQIA